MPRQVLVRRYVRRGEDGSRPRASKRCSGEWLTTWPGWKRPGAEDVLARARQYYELLTSKRFFPNSPTFTGAGTPLGQLAACFVLPISDDMGRDRPAFSRPCATRR